MTTSVLAVTDQQNPAGTKFLETLQATLVGTAANAEHEAVAETTKVLQVVAGNDRLAKRIAGLYFERRIRCEGVAGRKNSQTRTRTRTGRGGVAIPTLLDLE